MQFSWTGVGLWIPSCLHCLTNQSDRPSDGKSDILDVYRCRGLKNSFGIVYITENSKTLDFNAELNILVFLIGCRRMITQYSANSSSGEAARTQRRRVSAPCWINCEMLTTLNQDNANLIEFEIILETHFLPLYNHRFTGQLDFL